MATTALRITRVALGLTIALFVLVFLLSTLSPPAQASAREVVLPGSSATAPSTSMMGHHTHCHGDDSGNPPTGSSDSPTISSNPPPATGDSEGSQGKVPQSEPPRSPLCKVFLALAGSLAVVGVFGLSRLRGVKAH